MSDAFTTDAESIAAAEQEKIERAQRYRDIVSQAYAHVQRGDPLGPPDDRPASDLDAVVEGVVGALRAEVRLYPELWAWIVSDQVRLAILPDLDKVKAEAQVAALEDLATAHYIDGPQHIHDTIMRYADRIAREAGTETREEAGA